MSSTPTKKVSVGKIHKSTATAPKAVSILDRVSQVVSVKLVVVSAVLLACLTFSYLLYQKSTNVIHNYINASDDVLKKVIFGEQPHVWLCDRNTPNPTAGPRSDAMLSISPLFTQLHTIKGHEYPFGVVNCSQVLPSGKTMIERFKLKKEVKPMIWVTAPWTKAVQATPKDMKDIALLAKFVDTSLKPKATVMKSDKQLQHFCNHQKQVVTDDRDITETCFVLMRGEKHSKSQLEFEEKLVLEYPRAKFAAVDAKKLRLTYENIEDLPADHFALKIHALRNGTHFMSMENPLTWDYATTFMSHAVASPLYGFTEHSGGKDMVRLVKPSLMQRKAKKAAKNANKKKPKKVVEDEEEAGDDVENNNGVDGNTVDDKQKRKEARARERKRIAAEQKKKRADQQPSKEEPESSTEEAEGGEEEVVVDPEQLRQEQLQRERKRREEMEAQARAQLFEEDDEDADNSTAEDDEDHEGDGDAEEHIEL